MRRFTILVAYFVVCCAGLHLAFEPTIESRFARMQTDRGDTVLNNYLLEHSWRVIADASYRFSFLSPAFFYPQPHVLGYSESLLGTAPVYWVFRLIWMPAVAFSLWMMAWTALNFIGFAVVARWLKLSHLLSLLGAWLWAFGAEHLYQAGHQQLIPRFWMPFAVWHALRFVQSPNPRSLFLGLACTALQTACCVNTGVLLGYGLLAFSVIGLSLRPGGWRGMRSGCRRDYILAVSGGLGLCLLVLVPNLLANLGGGFIRGYSNAIPFMPTPAAWFAPPPDWRWNEWLGGNRVEVNPECYLFSGIAFPLLLVVALLSNPQRQLSRACALTAIVLALLVTNLGDGVSAWWLARFLPGGITIRAVGRAYVVTYLFIAYGGLLALQALLEPTRWQTFIALLIAGGIILEQTGFHPPSFEVAPLDARIDSLATLMAGADAAFVEASVHERWDVHTQLVAMWAGLRANVPVVNGYSGRLPPGYDYREQWTDDELRRWLGPDFKGRVAIVDPDLGTARILQLP